MQDTQPKATARYFELLRQCGQEKRLAMCASLCRATRELAIAGIKAAHSGPELTDTEIRRALAERLYGRQVAQRLFAAER